jgi:type IV pilus assembly protein PilV
MISARARLPAGFSLIEVLIALVVLTVGMLGLSGLYIESLKLNRSAIHRNAAITLAADMAERLRAGDRDPITGNEPATSSTEVLKQLPDGSTMNVRPIQIPDNGLVQGNTVKQYDIELRWPETGQKTAGTYTLTLYLPAE